MYMAQAKTIALTAACFSWFYALLASGMTLIWKGNQGNITAPRSPRLLHPQAPWRGKQPAPWIAPRWWRHVTSGTGRGWQMPHPARSQGHMVSQMANPRMPRPLLHIPAPHTVSSWSTWSLTHWPAAPGGIAAAGCCSAGVCDTGHLGEGKGGERGEKAKQWMSTFPVSCSVCETWQLAAWLYRDRLWQYRHCRKAQESHASPFTLSMWLVSLGAALAFNKIRQSKQTKEIWEHVV